MKSHTYAFRLSELARLFASLLVPLVLVAAVLRVGALTGILPAPWPALDVETTILTHQAEASRTSDRADVVLIGDSSCLMDASATGFEAALAGRHRCLNLGTFMYVGLDGYAALLSRYAAANPNRVATVVVLLHPEMLRGVTPIRHYEMFLSDYYAGEDYHDADTLQGNLRGLFGLDIFQDRCLSRMPLALPKEYGRRYGFNLDLYGFMDRHRGSALDPHQYTPGPQQGNAEYRFAPTLENGCLALRSAVPRGARLVIGMTPIPESFAPPRYSANWQEILRRWGAAIRSDSMLTNLPPTLPDAFFASTTHLNERGSAQFTEALARSVEEAARK